MTPETDAQLLEQVGSYYRNPLGYVMFAWPWGETPALRVVRLLDPWRSRYGCEYGPDGWQCEHLERLGELIVARGFDPAEPVSVMPIEMYSRSGHGIGKSALVGMLVSFLMDARPDSQGMVTANTGTQLKTKTWAQIKSWKRTAITWPWWDIGEESIQHVSRNDPKGVQTACHAVTWNKDRATAFHGQHAVTSTSYYIPDEASEIHNAIWTAMDGGLTDGEPMRFAFGNPTQTTGRFADAFKKDRARVDYAVEIDARTSQVANHALHAKWIEQYGIDSDFVRVKVLGKEPRSGERQLISTEAVAEAMRREIPYVPDDAPVVMGIDVALDPLGDEQVIYVRRGLDGRSFPMKTFRGLKLRQLAAEAAQWTEQLAKLHMRPSAIFCDAGGLGQGCIEPLQEWGYPVIPVNFGGTADDESQFANKAAEMWSRVKDWLDDGKGVGGALPDDEVLAAQLTSRPYTYKGALKLFLVPKDEVKIGLGLDSPDRADALALTFAFPIGPREDMRRDRVERFDRGHVMPALRAYNPED